MSESPVELRAALRQFIIVLKFDARPLPFSPHRGDSDCESVDEELEEDVISRMTPDLELAHPEYGPPLCVSAGRGNTACLRVLLQAGADVNCVSEDGR